MGRGSRGVRDVEEADSEGLGGVVGGRVAHTDEGRQNEGVGSGIAGFAEQQGHLRAVDACVGRRRLGENDIRVPRGQAAEVVATLKGVGATVDVHYYPEEGHGFARRENQIDSLQRTIDWFDKYLK